MEKKKTPIAEKKLNRLTQSKNNPYGSSDKLIKRDKFASLFHLLLHNFNFPPIYKALFKIETDGSLKVIGHF